MSQPELAVITYGALEMEAAAALIQLRYQFEDHEAENMCTVCYPNNVFRFAKPSQSVVLKRSFKYKPQQRSILRHLLSMPDGTQIYYADPEQFKQMYDFLDKQEIM